MGKGWQEKEPELAAQFERAAPGQQKLSLERADFYIQQTVAWGSVGLLLESGSGKAG